MKKANDDSQNPGVFSGAPGTREERLSEAQNSAEGPPTLPVPPAAAASIRAKAEEQLRRKPKDATPLTPERMQVAIHDLHLHQIELEMQNEQLRATQLELEVAHERYFELYDLAPVGYLTLSEKGLIQAANLTSARLLGMERSLLVSQPFDNFVLPEKEDQNAFYLCRRRVSASTEIQACEVRLCSKGGLVFWARLQAVQAVDGGVPVCRLTITDVTEQKRTESALREAVGELERFSYTLAHDLRAPLRSIRSFSDLLLAQATNLSPVHRRFLERNGAAVERMDQLIVDALNYSKIARQGFALMPVDCRAMLDELVESYPQFQEARNHISICRPIPAVLGSPALLTQCFSNLLANALKFVAPGQTPAVRIFAEDHGRRLRIWVEDNGIGIPEDCHERIFEMFQRLNPDYEGTGIGLTLVRKAAERMGGAVGVESKPGQGSRFWVELYKAAL